MNQKKHGVSFALAQLAFLDHNRVILEDLGHSDDEKRYYCLGKVADGIMTVRFTYRKNKIRIIGAGDWRKGKLNTRIGLLEGLKLFPTFFLHLKN